MDDAKLNGRRIFVWQGDDPYKDIENLAHAVADTAEIFNVNGALRRVNNAGQLSSVGIDALFEVINTRLATPRLTNRGTADKPNWIVELVPLELPEMILRAVLKRLPALVPKLSENGAPNSALQVPRSFRLEQALNR
jgi:hypothetical protein